jgi:enoyl-CoA hydratase/carnithine racemase
MTNPPTPGLRLETAGPVARLLLDRADKRNAMDQAMWAALPSLLAHAAADPAVRVLVLQSAQPGFFCAGADIAEMAAHRSDPAWLAANQAAINQAQFELARAALPTVAFVDGDCIGGGCGLALACDIRVASPRARFGVTPARLGLTYPLHDTKLLVDLVGPGQAKRLLFTAGLIDAAEAHRIGLAELLAESAHELAATIARLSPASHRGSKAFVRRVLDGQTADDAETLAAFTAAFAGPDFAEGTAAFLEKRAAEFGS